MQQVTPKEMKDMMVRLIGILDCYVTMHQYPSTIEAVREAEILLSRVRNYGMASEKIPVMGTIGGDR